MTLLRWTIGKKMFLMGLGIVLALGALAGMFYYTTDLIRQGTHASALRNQDLDLVNRLNESVITLILAAMDSIIDKDQGTLAEERVRIITEQTAYVQANLDPLAELADTAEEVRLADEIRATFPKLQTGIQVELVRLIEESAGQLHQIQQDFIAIDDTLDQYGDQIEDDLGLLKASIQQEQADATNVALLRNQQVAVLDKFLRAHATLMLAAMDVIIDRNSGMIAAEHRQNIQDSLAVMQANLKTLEELADTETEVAAAAAIRDTVPKLATGIQEDLVRLIETSARQAQPLEQDFMRIDDTLDAYGDQIEKSLGVMFASVQQEQVDASQLALRRNQQMNLLNTVSQAHSNLMLAAMDSIIDKDEGQIQTERLETIKANLGVLQNSLDSLDELADTDAEQAAAARIRETFPKLAEGIQGELTTLIAEGVVIARQIEADFDRLDDEIDRDGDAIQAALEQITLSVQREQQDAEAALLTTIEDIARIGIMVLSAALVILIITFSFFSRSISKPIIHGAEVASHLADGDLSVAVKVRGRDETGQLLRAMDHMVDKLQEIVIAVKSGAINVASGSQEMAQGAAEQAAAAEEASSSMEEMAANIRQNSDNALQTEKIALEAATNAREGGKAVAETVIAMKDIAQKITIIEEIARQTHMLSLNATIEAAKAQDYGRGFAVVAAEVRALAERSRTAANEINTLTGSSVATAVRAGELLAKVVPDIQKTAELVQEISAASREQNSGAEQINRAIQQLDQVIQQNASVSEELASQAEQLQGSIEFFKTAERRNGQRPGAAKALSTIAHLASSETSRPTTPPKTDPGYVMKLKPGNITGDDKDRDFERY